jgi:hypothetical protein
MDRLATERCHLVLADRHISEAEQRAAKLKALIERRRCMGGDDSSALALLRLIDDALTTFRNHRQSIREAITRLELAESK